MAVIHIQAADGARARHRADVWVRDERGCAIDLSLACTAGCALRQVARPVPVAARLWARTPRRLRMCIIAVASGCHSDFPLVCIHNREEVAGRPTSPCERRGNGVVCAVDELKGGTWMGMNVQTGLFCSLTNLRSTNPPRTEAASRGLLVRDLLEAPAAELASVLSSRRECEKRLRAATAARPYEGLNLCVGCWHPTADGSPPPVFYVSNVPPGANAIEKGSHEWKLAWSRGCVAFSPLPLIPTHDLIRSRGPHRWAQHVEQLAPGVTHAWSNDAPAAPAWPKSTWLRTNLARLLSSTHSLSRPSPPLSFSPPPPPASVRVCVRVRARARVCVCVCVCVCVSFPLRVGSVGTLPAAAADGAGHEAARAAVPSDTAGLVLIPAL